MSESAAAKAYELWKAGEGSEEATGEWWEMTQERINQFADVTEDHQFIHVDAERAKATPFGGTIAHGFLTLSMLTHLDAITPNVDEPGRYEGVTMGVNYGFDKVRFVNPVLAGKRVRARAVTSNVELKGTAINSTRSFTVEIEGEDKPALIAEWIGRSVFDS